MQLKQQRAIKSDEAHSPGCQLTEPGPTDCTLQYLAANGIRKYTHQVS